MKVKASAGLKVPMEFNSQAYITEDKAVEVDESAYYLRRLSDGDLVLVPEKESKAKA